MENLSDDDFRSYINDFQSYLHNISDLGPIEPSSVSPASPSAAAAAAGVDAIQSVPEEQADVTVAAESSSDDRSAMSHRATGRTIEEDPDQGLDEDDEDRIISEGCDLDCGIKEPDLIPTRSRPGWRPPDIAREEEAEDLAEAEGEGDYEEGSSVDPVYGQNEDASPEEWQVETLKPRHSNRIDEVQEEEEEEDWAVETLKPNSRPAAPDLGFGDDQGGADDGIKDDGSTGGGDGDDHSSSSPAVEQKTGWKYFADGQTLQSYEQSDGHGRQIVDLNGDGVMTTSGEKVIGQTSRDTELNEQDSNSGVWEKTAATESRNKKEEAEEEEDPRDDPSSDEDDHFALDRSQSATLVKTNRTSVVHEEVSTAFEAAAAHLTGVEYSEKAEEHLDQVEQQQEESEDSAKRSSGYYHELVPEDEVYFGTAGFEKEATVEQRRCDDQPNSSVAETKSSEGKQNGAAQLRIYPSQVRKTNNIFPPDETDRRNNGCEGPESPAEAAAGENGAEEEEEGGRDLPEQGSVKTLLAQWRQIEQQKRKAAAAAVAVATDGEPEEDHETKPTRSRVRDEILRMRSQSCDPLSSRKHNRLSPNDDDDDEVTTAGTRVGRGRSRGTGNEEDDEGEEEEEKGGVEHYRSQPSLSTKAIMAKFENLDLQAANSAAKPKTSKNFKWQVKETTSFCRPGFQPRSGR